MFNPIPVAIQTPAIFTISDLKNAMVIVPYGALSYFPTLANVLVELEQRNATRLTIEIQIGDKPNECTTPPASSADIEPRQFIACTGAINRFNLCTYDALVDHANSLVEKNKFLSEAWARLLHLSVVKSTPKHSRQVFDGSPGANQTSNSLLFVSCRRLLRRLSILLRRCALLRKW